MHVLAIDIGSSTIKGAVLDLERLTIGETVRTAFPEPMAGIPRGRFEVALSPIIAGVEHVLSRLAEMAPGAEAAVFCGQMGGVLLVDQGGRPLSNYLSWRDQRTLDAYRDGGNYLDEIRHRWSAGELEQVGHELQPGSAASLLFWLAAQRELPTSAMPLTLGDYVLSRLCNSEPITEPTQALGLLHLATGDWHHAALERLGLADLRWPRLADWREPAGTWRMRGGVIACHGVVGDQQCALRGAGLEEGELSINISTGSQVSLLTRRLQLGPYQTRPYFDGAYLNTITHLPAGRALNVLVDFLSELPRARGVTIDDPWSYIAQAAAESRESDLEASLTFFAGPMGNTGRIDNITVDNLTIGNLFRAAFRHMAENYWQCAGRLSERRDWRRIVLSGGLAQRVPPLRRAILDRFGGEYREQPEGEDVLLGLLSLWNQKNNVSKSS